MSVAINLALVGPSDVSSSADGERNEVFAPPTPESEKTKSELSAPADSDLKHLLKALVDGQKELLARQKPRR